MEIFSLPSPPSALIFPGLLDRQEPAYGCRGRSAVKTPEEDFLNLSAEEEAAFGRRLKPLLKKIHDALVRVLVQPIQYLIDHHPSEACGGGYVRTLGVVAHPRSIPYPSGLCDPARKPNDSKPALWRTAGSSLSYRSHTTGLASAEIGR